MGFSLAGLLSRDTVTTLHNMAVRTIVRRYEHEAAHAEALQLDRAYSKVLGRVIRPIPNADSLYYIRSAKNPAQTTRGHVGANVNAMVGACIDCGSLRHVYGSDLCVMQRPASAATKDGVRKVTSGGPINREAHVSYQRAYQSGRKAKGFGVKFPSGRVVRYKTRAMANAARKVVGAVKAAC